MEALDAAPELPRYTPWPKGSTYRPGWGEAPDPRCQPEYGDCPEVGDLLRLGNRIGDPRCADCMGSKPCAFCVLESTNAFEYEDKIMPGLSPEKLKVKDPLTNMPFRHPHPFMSVTKEMNTGRGCDTYGRAYGAPPRYEHIQVFKFDENDGGYRKGKEYELDFGPEKHSEEFQTAMKDMQEAPEFKEWEQEIKTEDAQWAWTDPVEPTPWENIEKVDPNGWMADLNPEEPLEAHAEKIRAWAQQEYAPWPEARMDSKTKQ